MKPVATSPADGGASPPPVRVVVVTLDKHLSGVVARAEAALRRDMPGLVLDLHAATDWAEDREALGNRCIADIGRGDIVIASMLFMEDHVRVPCCRRWKRAAITATPSSASCARLKS